MLRWGALTWPYRGITDAFARVLPLAVAKILRALALQETPDLLILGKVLPPGEVAHRSTKGFVSEDEFLSIPEFSINPLSRVCLPSSSHRRGSEFCSPARFVPVIPAPDD
ncbi:uncharacterized protein LOC119271342 [Triticum dicoccoides]|uniref:uncharacterized protein LOC119271342 n=1 Tax=Triticum dicoccoides TaxID=85692 RepID=UPI00188FF247|nr:uncharacterized protein LOC119271342 [Triticum dicoccoides]